MSHCFLSLRSTYLSIACFIMCFICHLYISCKLALCKVIPSFIMLRSWVYKAGSYISEMFGWSKKVCGDKNKFTPWQSTTWDPPPSQYRNISFRFATTLRQANLDQLKNTIPRAQTIGDVMSSEEAMVRVD